MRLVRLRDEIFNLGAKLLLKLSLCGSVVVEDELATELK
jgi:hypothetical protein